MGFLIVIWALMGVVFAAQFIGLWLLFRRYGATPIAIAVVCFALVGWLSRSAEAGELAARLAFFPWMALWALAHLVWLGLWPFLGTAVIICAVLARVRPSNGASLLLWVVLSAVALAEGPAFAQDLVTRRRAEAQASSEGLRSVELPRFREAARRRYGAGGAWLRSANGRAVREGTLYLWSYRHMAWRAYGPIR